MFKSSGLVVEMKVERINGKIFKSTAEGEDFLKEYSSIMKLLVHTQPSTGTVYTICRRKDQKKKHTVFIPDFGGNNFENHCVSDFYIHTVF